jgi:ABC-type sugar transport system substrate-binding protein
MKNIKKLGLILVIALTFGISSVGMAAEPDYTIGITIWGGSHPWSIQACNFANYIANILNCKIVVTYHNVRPEDEINNMENYVSSKADAVISWAPSGTITPKCAETSEMV